MKIKLALVSKKSLIAAIFFSLVTSSILTSSICFARDVALTFDDCPRKSGPVLKPMDRDQKLIAALKSEGVKAAFFCNSPTRQPDGRERLKFFAQAGHFIANHTDQHPDLNKIGPDAFNRAIDQADSELHTLPNFRKWFRFPFLREGKAPADVEAVRAHLKKNGYSNGYVTIDNEDWFADEVLRKKVDAGHGYDEAKLCQTYAGMVADEAEFFDSLAVKALGRSPKHVLLLHETDLNAICLTTLMKVLKKQKWNFVSPEEAYRDPIASQEPKSSTKLNNGRVYALALETSTDIPTTKKWNSTDDIEKELERQKVWK